VAPSKPGAAYDDRSSQLRAAEEAVLLVLIGMMVLVVIGFSALALTSADTVRTARRGTRAVVTGMWLVFVLAGWLATAWIVTQAPGGATVAWAWVQAQTTLAQAAMWLLLLPWTAAVWILQSDWPAWMRFVAVVALALTTIGLTVGQFAEALRQSRH
jgi:ABC-type multidrug transport system permease subunit